MGIISGSALTVNVYNEEVFVRLTEEGWTIVESFYGSRQPKDMPGLIPDDDGFTRWSFISLSIFHHCLLFGLHPFENDEIIFEATD